MVRFLENEQTSCNGCRAFFVLHQIQDVRSMVVYVIKPLEKLTRTLNVAAVRFADG